MPDPPILRFDALALVDGDGFCARPGSALVNIRAPAPAGEPAPLLLATGTPSAVDAHPAAGHARTVSRPRAVLIPGLVNAHTHLDLTHLGPQPHDPDDGFVAWVDRLRAARAVTDDHITTSVQRGIELSLAGGVVAVGDIAGCPVSGPTLTPWRSLTRSPLLGVSYLEYFAIGSGFQSRLDRAAAALNSASQSAFVGLVRLGLQPHAPNTVEPGGYEWAVAQARRRGLSIATHLAETLEERRFIARADGPQREMLERFRLWEPRLEQIFGHGLTPIAHLRTILEAARPLVAHVNDCPNDDLRILAATGASVAYCPRASAYFDAPARLGPHRYRDMLAAGINVCLGTDSIVNLPPESADPARGGMSPLDEARLLRARDGADCTTLLRMATINGAAALGLETQWFRLRPRAPAPIAGLVAVPAGTRATSDPARLVIESTDAPELLLDGKSSDPTKTGLPGWT